MVMFILSKSLWSRFFALSLKSFKSLTERQSKFAEYIYIAYSLEVDQKASNIDYINNYIGC
eukprot:snap_masked-scaffold_126-processed-gene-0.3-mRNA-1 protein AED:1.00 eAED:1.00 QI:0/0/0/0/1/1/2/0/60